jgi:GNAT superfamily N-acetyltransferase
LADPHYRQFLSLVDTLPEQLYGPGKKLAFYHLQTFGVLPEHQKKGYGTAWMAAVEEKVFYS